MDKIIIEKFIPIPSKSKEKYPFSEMEVGDSFFVKGDNKYLRQTGK